MVVLRSMLTFRETNRNGHLHFSCARFNSLKRKTGRSVERNSDRRRRYNSKTKSCPITIPNDPNNPLKFTSCPSQKRLQHGPPWDGAPHHRGCPVGPPQSARRERRRSAAGSGEEAAARRGGPQWKDGVLVGDAIPRGYGNATQRANPFGVCGKQPTT